MANFAYIRTSTAAQSVENQKIEIDHAGYKIDYWYIDKNISGKVHTSMRKEFTNMLSFIRDGETIVVSKLDRLGRDAMDINSTVHLLLKRNINLVVLGLGSLDITTSEGKYKAAMLGAMAELEHSLLVERTKAGLERAKAQGKKLGRRSKTTTKQKEEIINLFNLGETKSSLSRKFNISRSTVLGIITNG